MERNKSELRKEIRRFRNALPLEMRKEKSVRIASLIIRLQEFQRANVVLLYSAIKSEVETELIYEVAKQLQKQVYYPRVIGDEMEFYLVDEGAEFVVSNFGVREPKIDEAKRYVPKENSSVFVIVPGVAFDTAGNRIGYGGGYYDKYLQKLMKEVTPMNVCKAAVAYECQVVALGTIKSEPHDMRVDYIVTEKEMYKI